jgi:hypothetical protein
VTELPAIVLAPTRSVAGRVVDRQGQPTAGAEVIAGGAGVAARIDPQGRFRLDGLPQGPALLVVRRDGFRIDGRVLGERDGEVEFALARFNEPPARTMTTLPSPLPLEERRKLARRVLDPYLVKVLAKGTDTAKSWALRSLMAIDPAAALEALERTTFERPRVQSSLRRMLAKELARDDLEEATAVAESIAAPSTRAGALVELSDELPSAQRTRKVELLDRALVSARAESEPVLRLWQLGEVAERLLELGEAERAKALFAEGRAVAEKLAATTDWRRIAFIFRLGRVDLPAALALAEGIDGPNDRCLLFGNIAARLAASDPAAAERLLEKIKGLRRDFGPTLRTCQNMARADLPRARRIALAQEDVGSRAAALVFVAYGLPASERAAARGLVRQALEEVDRGWDTSVRSLGNALPALMPLVESIDPALVPELFWRAVAGLAVGNDPRDEFGRDDALRVALLLARYDRTVAASLFEPAAQASTAQGADAGRMIPSVLMAMAAIDPLRAVAAVEAMPEPPHLDARGANWSRITLSGFLGWATKRQWSHIWTIFSGLGDVLGQRDAL